MSKVPAHFLDFLILLPTWENIFSGLAHTLEIIIFNSADNSIWMIEITYIKELSITAGFKISAENYIKIIPWVPLCWRFFSILWRCCFVGKPIYLRLPRPIPYFKWTLIATIIQLILFFVFRTDPILYHQPSYIKPNKWQETQALFWSP